MVYMVAKKGKAKCDKVKLWSEEDLLKLLEEYHEYEKSNSRKHR